MKVKTPVSHKVVCFQMLGFETKSNLWKITSFLITTLLQRELLLLTMFYTINSSPLLLTKYCFILIIILSNYH